MKTVDIRKEFLEKLFLEVLIFQISKNVTKYNQNITKISSGKVSSYKDLLQIRLTLIQGLSRVQVSELSGCLN